MINIWFGGNTPVWRALLRTMTMTGSAIAHVIFWPVVMHWKKFLCEATYQTSQGEERVKARIARDDATIVSSRSQMIEVCSESSFQPLLQLYLFLPTLIVSFNTFGTSVNLDHRASDFFFNISHLQFWSILTSCLSLSWSFKRQLAVDGTFLLENVAIIIFAALRLDLNDVWPLLVFVFLGQLCGTLFKAAYYKFFHIWSNILHMKDFEA